MPSVALPVFVRSLRRCLLNGQLCHAHTRYQPRCLSIPLADLGLRPRQHPPSLTNTAPPPPLMTGNVDLKEFRSALSRMRGGVTEAEARVMMSTL